MPVFLKSGRVFQPSMLKTVGAMLLCLALLLPAAVQAAGCRFISHGSREVKQVALTFDDLWEASLVAEILDIAADHGAHITLFPCGGAIQKEDGALWRRALDDGHEIGNHSTSHKDFTTLDSSAIAWQLHTMQKRLDAALGYPYQVKFVRIPYGSGWREGSHGPVGRAIFAAGYEHVLFWDVDESSAGGILKKVKNGSIVVLHGIHRDVAMLSGLMDGLQDRGYALVTAGEMLGITARTTRELYFYTGAADEAGAPVVFGEAVITASTANIRAGGDTDALLLLKAATGEAFPLLGIDAVSGWYALLLPNGNTGYVGDRMAKAEFIPLQ